MIHSFKNKESLSDAKRIRVQISEDIYDLDMSEFITKGLIVLFDSLNLSCDFLDMDPLLWNTNKNYINCLKFFRELKVVNDMAERAVALIEKYNQFGTKDEEQKQYLLQIVAAHRKKYPNCNKNNYK